MAARGDRVDVDQSGSWESLSRLTGDWGGRDDLVKKGVVFDADVYWAPQAITGGGKDDATPSLVPVHAGTIEVAPRVFRFARNFPASDPRPGLVAG